MDKKDFLRQAARKYVELLADQGKKDSQLLEVLDYNSQLFDDIEIGLVVPPCLDRYKAVFNSEHPQYGGRTEIFSAESEFISAIEDWRSRSWYPR